MVVSKLTKEAQELFDGFTDLPDAADASFEQMVETALPTAQEIVDANMNARAVFRTTRAKLTYADYQKQPMPDLFCDITVHVLSKMLADTDFAAELMPIWMGSVSQGLTSIRDRQTQTHAMLRQLIDKFEVDPKHKD